MLKREAAGWSTALKPMLGDEIAEEVLTFLAGLRLDTTRWWMRGGEDDGGGVFCWGVTWMLLRILYESGASNVQSRTRRMDSCAARELDLKDVDSGSN